MSKKIKGLICALIAGMMVTTSCGLTSLAADDTSSDQNAAESTATEMPEGAADADITDEEKDAADATEAPAATENADATEAPASTEAAQATEAPDTADQYENDTYYQNALQLCSALGIIEGYEDGSVQPESTVTRAEMATIILRMLNTASTSTYANVFLDVAADHWAANNIQTAVEQGIVNGMGDGTFQPDGNVTYEQVIKMLVCALNYTSDAERSGGYPNGYISVGGTTLSLLDSVNGRVGDAMTRGEVIKAVYNAVRAPYRAITGFENNNPVYSARDTLGVEKFNLYEDKGVLTATPNMTISTGTTTKEDRIVIDGVQYICTLDGLDDMLGTPVEFFYVDSNIDDPEVITIFKSGNNEEYTFDADDISEMDYESGDLRVYTSETSSSTRRYDIGAATVIYNGSVLTSADFAASEYADDEAFNDFIVPEVGTVKVIDYDTDGNYDVLMIDSYETMLVTSATSEKLSGKINNANTVIDVNNDANDKTITVSKSGSEATVRNLRKNDVASIKRNIDGTMIDITVTGETVTGEIESVGEDDGTMTIVVNGQEYDVDVNAEETVRLGASVILYLDKFDRVGYIESSTGSMLSGSEKYAVIANAYIEDNGDVSVKLFNQDGEAVTLTANGTVKYWGSKDAEATTISSTDLVDELSDDNSYLQCDSMPLKLCKYRVNSKGQLSQLYVATAATDENENTDALRVYNNGGNTSLKGITSVGGTVQGYYIEDGIIEFTVPESADDRTNPANYSIGTVTSSAYVNYENGSNWSYAIGDFVNGRYPGVLVRFQASSSEVSAVDAYSNANNGPTFMLSRIIESVDSEGDTVYELVGYTGGSEVRYTTASNTGIYDFTGWADREYAGTLVFDATDSSKDDISVIHPGDIFFVGADGSTAKTLIRMIDVEDLAKTVVTGSADQSLYPAATSYSTSRDMYYSGLISEVDIEDSAFIGLTNMDSSESGTVAYDLSTVFNYVTLTVDTNGNIINTRVDQSGGMEPGEILPYGDDPTEFDVGFFKQFKGAMQNGYIVRVQIEES